MASDCYRVEILHFINPHLIWVEVHLNNADKSDECRFEQLGIFGILPLEFNIDIIEKCLKTKRSKDWTPAASARMITLLDGAKEVWFTTTLIDQRTTIFDDNIFKFGEIIIVSPDDTQIQLSKALVEGNFAMYDACLFNQELANGKLNIKLCPVQTQEVIKQFHRYYKKKNQKERYEQSLQKHMTVSEAASEIHNALTVANIERHNLKQHDRNTLIQKMKDLQLCKGVDEESVGRGCKTLSRVKKDVTFDNKANDNIKKNDTTDLLSFPKKIIDCYAVKKKPSTISLEEANNTKTTVSEDIFIEQIEDKCNNNIPIEKKEENIPVKDVNKTIGNLMMSRAAKTYKNLAKDKTSQNTHNAEVPNSTNKSTKSANPFVAFGPPGQSIQKLKLTAIENAQKVCNPISNTNSINSNIDKAGRQTTLNSKFLQRKIIIQKEKESHDRLSVSKPNNKDTNSNSKFNDANDDNSDKKELQVLEQQLSEIYKPLVVNNKTEESIPMKFAYDKNNVNPFNNIDVNISVFVDKLATPVLMVHSKMNKRIEPRCDLRDIPFNNSIRAMLRTMRIAHPMTLQTVSWCTILRGHSLFIISPAGSGKTMGYIPAVCRLVTDSQVDSVGSVGPIAIIVCATSRSVAEVKHIANMCLGLKEKVITCFTGMDVNNLTTKLLNGCDLLISTPSMLYKLFQLTDFGVDLRRLTTFVLDDCERLAEVYSKEIKFCQLKIKEMLKNRANKEQKVQYILASRLWCDFMEPLAKKVPDTVICIGAFQECVLYAKAPTTVKFVTKESKPEAVLDFLKDIDLSKRIVIVCRRDEEVNMLEKVLAKTQNTVYACNNTMTVIELYNLNLAWADCQDPLLGPILLCCDHNLVHMNITDASYLLHYSLPQLYSSFSKRFAVLNDNYPSIFETDTKIVKVNILVDDTNVEQLPKILNFIKRCTSEVPEMLEEISEKVLADRNLAKANNNVPICNNLLALGECPDIWNCQQRHAVFKEFDEPKPWMPRNGVITFKILHYHTAVTYSARLISNIDNGQVKEYPQTYSTLSLKMGMFFSKETNKRPHGIPKLGDICAVSLKQNYYARCQILKILNYHPNNTPNYVLIKLIDEERYERSQDVYLYHLPEDLKNIETHVANVYLCNIQPKDKDVNFSSLALNELHKITDEDEELYLRGKVTLTIGNCIFVDTLEACQTLKAMNEIVVKHDFKQKLLNTHAIVNPEHRTKLLDICSDVIPPESVVSAQETAISELSVDQIKVKPQWAHLEHDDFSSVFFASAVSPEKFYVRLAKFEDCMHTLINDIQKYIRANQRPVTTRNVGDIVLAKFPDDGTFERARIDDVLDDKAKCFFVDQGDWRCVNFDDLFPITEKLITQMPFQAIECRLIGVKPFGEEWTEFSTNWFCDNCYEDNHEFLKNLCVKYFTKEQAESSGGHKYGVVLIDTTGQDDVIINKLLIDVNLATEIEDEINYLNELQFTNNVEEDADSENDDEWEKIGDNKVDTIASLSPKSSIETVTAASLLLRQPTRSMPLIGDDDSSDSDRWDMNMTHEFLNTFKSTSQTVDDENNFVSEETPVVKNQSNHNKVPSTNQDNDQTIKSLDSDDLTTPENSELLVQPTPVLDEKRKPKVVWRQTKTTITMKILLICDKYELGIQQKRLTFSSIANDTEYGFEIDLYGVLNLSKCRHSNKGQYILVNLTKILPRNWLTFAKEPVGNKWIVYDVDSIDISSDEEEVNTNDLVNIVKNMHNKADSESEEDDFLDDVNFTYRK